MDNFVKNSLTFFTCCLSLGLASGSVAQSNIAPNFEGAFSITPMYVENATGVIEQEDQVNEMQTAYSLGIDADLTSELSKVIVGYELTEMKYQDDTQPDDAFWEGESSLVLGNSTTFYELTSSHSVRRILIQPDASAILLANSDARDIFSVRPLLRTSPGNANTLALAYVHSAIDFKDTESNDSTRAGVDLYYIRNISPTRELAVTIGEREVDYDTSDSVDYDSRFITMTLNVERRYYDYNVEVGYTKVTPVVGESYTSPTVNLGFSTQQGLNSFIFFANRVITDSSLGNGNSDFFSQEVSFDSALGEGDRDQVKRSSIGLGWNYAGICSRCRLIMNAGLEKVENVNLTENNSKQVFADVGFGYDFSRAISTLVSVRETETSFIDAAASRGDSTTRISRVDIGYEYNQMLNFSLLHEIEARESDSTGNYTVKTTSLEISVAF